MKINLKKKQNMPYETTVNNAAKIITRFLELNYGGDQG
jgi:hypothetical protein